MLLASNSENVVLDAKVSVYWASVMGMFVSFYLRVVVQLLSCGRLPATLWTAARQASLSITNSWSLLRLMSIESVMPSNDLVLCCSLLLPSIFPSIRVFSNGLALCIRWPKYWSFTFSISLSNEYSGLISFGIDRFDLLAVQGTLKSLLQHHNLKASVLWCSAFFMVLLSHPYMITGKTIVLTIQTFVCKVVSLFFNTSVTLGKRTSLFLCAPCFKSEIAWHDFTGMWKKCQIKLQR